VKIVLREDVENLGKKGDLLDVANGYGRNFLVPRGLAILATRGAVQQAESMRRSRSVRDAREREAAQALATQLAANRVTVAVRTGEGGKLFGSVTAADVAEAIAAQLGQAVDRRRLQLPDSIKELGEYDVALRLHSDVVVNIGVDVVEG
jgi:large subunit ribosomal protein L9